MYESSCRKLVLNIDAKLESRSQFSKFIGLFILTVTWIFLTKARLNFCRHNTQIWKWEIIDSRPHIHSRIRHGLCKIMAWLGSARGMGR